MARVDRPPNQRLKILWERLGPPKNDVLVYVGLNRGRMFKKIYWQYKQAFGFEANPILAEKLREIYKRKSRVRIIHAAVTDGDEGTVEFHISNDHGVSSSLHRPNDSYHAHRERKRLPRIEMNEVRVPAINLDAYLKEQGIDRITDYISDAEGMDLSILKTIRGLVSEGRIDRITCEVNKDRTRDIYVDAPDNSKESFMELLRGNYDLVAEGIMRLRDGTFKTAPEDHLMVDCRWKLRGTF